MDKGQEFKKKSEELKNKPEEKEAKIFLGSSG